MIKRVRQCIARRLVKRTARKTSSLFHEARRLNAEARSTFERAETASRCTGSLTQVGDVGLAERTRSIAAENFKIAARLNETARKQEENVRAERQRARKIARIIAGKPDERE